MLIQKGKFESNFSRSFVCFIFQKRFGFLLTIKNSAIFKGILRAKIDQQTKRLFPKKFSE